MNVDPTAAQLRCMQEVQLLALEAMDAEGAGDGSVHPHQVSQHTSCSPLEASHHKVIMPRPGHMTVVSRTSQEGPADDCQRGLYKRLSNLQSSSSWRTVELMRFTFPGRAGSKAPTLK